ncbi:MAG TPA: thiamine pyrophosphate-dependent dehydrogenase E1 component subunit alpha [Solirubrobacterales bacterium]|nr:thiamine pyrophosphate-dependent dehydrogenase E1 component subunit alpha [Solirubrobacterales bacterium]
MTTKAASESTEPTLGTDEQRALFARMVEIRSFEEAVQRMFAKGLVRGTTHLCQGQEAVAVGACAALREGDTMTCTYRGHGAVLAMGAPLDRAFGEILGRAGGLCNGKGGSMHLTDVSVGALGSFAIVGAHLPISVGAAFTAQQRGSGAVSVTFFGDGSTNIGTFHEAMNLAAVWRLPVIFLCENNLYGEYSPLATTTPVADLTIRASSYDMAASRVDGNDVIAVWEAVAAAAARARKGEGPTFIEALTYRFVGHSRSDPASYRPDGELDQWKKRDPIALFAERLIESGVADADEVAALRAGAEQSVAEAEERALSWPPPDLQSRLEDVYA